MAGFTEWYAGYQADSRLRAKETHEQFRRSLIAQKDLMTQYFERVAMQDSEPEFNDVSDFDGLRGRPLKPDPPWKAPFCAQPPFKQPPPVPPKTTLPPCPVLQCPRKAAPPPKSPAQRMRPSGGAGQPRQRQQGSQDGDEPPRDDGGGPGEDRPRRDAGGDPDPDDEYASALMTVYVTRTGRKVHRTNMCESIGPQPIEVQRTPRILTRYLPWCLVCASRLAASSVSQERQHPGLRSP